MAGAEPAMRDDYDDNYDDLEAEALIGIVFMRQGRM
jgi:hypothetical protein